MIWAKAGPERTASDAGLERTGYSPGNRHTQISVEEEVADVSAMVRKRYLAAYFREKDAKELLMVEMSSARGQLQRAQAEKARFLRREKVLLGAIECPICFGAGLEMALTGCGHIFCFGCLSKVAKIETRDLIETTCCLCRQIVGTVEPF